MIKGNENLIVAQFNAVPGNCIFPSLFCALTIRVCIYRSVEVFGRFFRFCVVSTVNQMLFPVIFAAARVL